MIPDSVGMYFRGLLEMPRQNFEQAITGFSKARNHLGAERRIASALVGLGRPREAVCVALPTTYQREDLRELPCLVFESTRTQVPSIELKALNKGKVTNQFAEFSTTSENVEAHHVKTAKEKLEKDD